MKEGEFQHNLRDRNRESERFKVKSRYLLSLICEVVIMTGKRAGGCKYRDHQFLKHRRFKYLHTEVWSIIDTEFICALAI